MTTNSEAHWKSLEIFSAIRAHRTRTDDKPLRVRIGSERFQPVTSRILIAKTRLSPASMPARGWPFG